MPQNKPRISAYNKAVDLLSIRMHTSFELAQKLKRKGFDLTEVEGVIAKLKAERYLNDDNTALMYLENLMRYKTYGFYGIKAKMMQKGIANSLIENLLSEHLTVEAETILAQKALGKSYKKDSQKLAMMLKRKGFRSQVIAKLVNVFDTEE